MYDERSGNFVRHSGVDWQSDYNGAPALANNLNVTAINGGPTIGLGANVGTSFKGVTGANLSNTTVGAASSINVSSTARVH